MSLSGERPCRRRDCSRRRPRIPRWRVRPFGEEVASHGWKTRPFETISNSGTADESCVKVVVDRVRSPAISASFVAFEKERLRPFEILLRSNGAARCAAGRVANRGADTRDSVSAVATPAASRRRHPRAAEGRLPERTTSAGDQSGCLPVTSGAITPAPRTPEVTSRHGTVRDVVFPRPL